jgi:septal ring factor EnvC (AmiA/AmiB activator)
MTVRRVMWLPMLAAFALGCGYSEDEWQMQLSKYRDLQSSSEAAQKKLSDELKAERDKVAQLAAELEKAGVNIGELKSTLSDTGSKLDKMTLTVAEQQRALIEYQAKAKQLELIKARFETAAQEARRAHQAGPRGQHPQEPHGHLAARRRALRLRQGDAEERGPRDLAEGRQRHQERPVAASGATTRSLATPTTSRTPARSATTGVCRSCARVRCSCSW